MIAQLQGDRENLTDVIDRAGVGYFVEISLHTLIPDGESKLYTYLGREDAHRLFGFAEK
jgi:Holliday junction resolvasome RuvABC DNA-binding subunit